jgi:hypothetical protein
VRKVIDIEHIKLQFARLSRHTENATSKFDPITYLDLAHCLRIWVDMKSDIDRNLELLKVTPQFNVFSPDKKIKSALRGSKYVAITGDSRVTGAGKIDGFVFTDKVISDDDVEKILKMGPPTARKTNLSFTQWLGSEIIVTNVSLPDQQPRLGISIEMLIKRVASFFGASHPMGMESSQEVENKFDPHIQALNEIKIFGNIPSTYYQLLQIAQTITETLKPVFGE